MLWGCFAASGPEALVKNNGIMNSTKYQDILAKNLVAAARKLRLGRWFCENQCFAMAISVSGLWTLSKTCGLNWRGQSISANLRIWRILKGYAWRNGPTSLQMSSPTLLSIIEIGSVPLSLPGEAAPSTKNSNNCETPFFFYFIIWKMCNFGRFNWIINKVKYVPHFWKLQYIWVMVKSEKGEKALENTYWIN